MHKRSQKKFKVSEKIEIIILVLFIVVLSLGIVFAGTEEVNAATKKIRIPNTKVYADARVVNAFKELDFKVKFDKNMKYAGTFSVAKHAIILKKPSRFNTLHEMGHFLSRLHDGADSTKEFKKIYKVEKKKYAGRKKSYVTKNSREYFAESFRQYTTWNKGLKKQRPKTYAYIDKMVKTITDEDIENMYEAYGWAW